MKSRSQLRTLFLAAALAILNKAAPAHAETARATPADRTAVEACLQLVARNAEKEAQSKIDKDPPGAEGRLAAAARDSATQRESCVGAVAIPCQDEPGGASTMGMVNCTTREWAVWNERLNRAYRDALKDASPRLVKALRETQRAWLRWREKRCRMPGLDNEGGSIGPLEIGCMLDVTARQALWLEHRE